MGEMESIPSAGEKRSGRRSALVLVSLYILFPCNINVALARRRRKEGNGPSRLTTGPGGEKGRLNFVRRRGGGLKKKVSSASSWFRNSTSSAAAMHKGERERRINNKKARPGRRDSCLSFSLSLFGSSPFEKALSPEETPFLRNRQGSPD